MTDEATKTAVADLLEALRPLDAHAKAMFGGYCFYVRGTVTGLVCDGAIFVKRSPRDELLDEYAELAPAYPGARDTWRLPVSAVRDEPDRVRFIIASVAEVLPAAKRGQGAK